LLFFGEVNIPYTGGFFYYFYITNNYLYLVSQLRNLSYLYKKEV